MRKRTVKRILVMGIIIVLSNYLKGKLPFSLYGTILYWDFPIEETAYPEKENCLPGRNTCQAKS